MKSNIDGDAEPCRFSNRPRTRGLIPHTPVLLMGLMAVALQAAAAMGQPCNPPPIPGPGQHVIWTAAQSPYRICNNLTIPASGGVSVEPGARIDFNAGTTLTVSGTLEFLGLPGQEILLTHPAVFPSMVTVEGGDLIGEYADFRGQLRVHSGATVDIASCHFTGNGLIWSQELQPEEPLIRLVNCTFDATYMVASDAVVILEGNTFTDSNATILRGNADVTAVNTFIRGVLNITRETEIQPMYVDGVHASGVTSGGGLALTGGNFLLGPNNRLQNNAYALNLNGGLMPGSVVPLTGNSADAIAVGGGRGYNRWSNLGLPYRMVDGSGGGNLQIDPGVLVQAAHPSAALVFQAGPRLIAEGLPEEPIVLEGLNGASWQGLIFHVASTSGPRLEYVTIRDARLGAISSDNFLYVDNCLFEDNDTGANANSFGGIEFRKTLFRGNAAGVSVTDLGFIDLDQADTPNAFEGNAAAIDAFEFGSDAEAANVWWGHPSGPQHPNNPGGQGDPIIGPGTPNVQFQPFLTERPDFGNTPPVVRMVEPNFHPVSPGIYFEPGEKYIVRWDVQSDDAVVAQRIEFSPDGHYPTRFTLVADDLSPAQRSYEWTVPSPGFAVTNQPQFLRVIAVDEAGQEGWDQAKMVVSSDRLEGQLTITTSYEGMTFHPGDEFPQIAWTGSVSQFPSITPYIVLENDADLIAGHPIGNQGFFLQDSPHISTDRARLAVSARNNSNDVLWFFADHYFTIDHDPRLAFQPPSVTVTSPAPGASFNAGGVVPVAWTAEAPEGLYSFDVMASYDGGRTWHVVVAELPAAARSYNWRLAPGQGIENVGLRVVVRDIRFHNRSDETSFTIQPGGGVTPGDTNCDGVVDAFDIEPFILALTDPNGYAAQFPNCDIGSADANGDGVVDAFDIEPFIALLTGP